MTVFLLDINVLLALADPMHVHHEICHKWYAEKGHISWATCPMTQNGFIRIASHPKYPNRPGEVAAVCSILRQFCEAPGHHFWTEELSILEILEPENVISHAQITDIYLLGLAARKSGKLATLDRRIPVDIISCGRQAYEPLLS